MNFFWGKHLPRIGFKTLCPFIGAFLYVFFTGISQGGGKPTTGPRNVVYL
jgi:hypothetical protein